MIFKLWLCTLSLIFSANAFAQAESNIPIRLESLGQTQPKMTFTRVAGSTTKLLSVEIFRFVTAMVIVEIAKCFGFNGDMRSKLEMKGPAFIAGMENPACMTQLGQMLRDPIFYAGFSMFIIGNHLTASFLQKSLHYYDPHLKKPGSQFLGNIAIPQFSMAVGFMFDHITNTILHNPYFRTCSADFFSPNRAQPMMDLLNDPSNQKVIGHDEDGNEIVEQKLNSNCQKMWLNLGSDQFLKEEITMGLAGLLTTFGTMSGGTALASGLIKYSTLRLLPASQVAAYYGSLAKRGLHLVLRGNLVGTAVMSLGHMVAFLGVFEVINRHVIQPIYLGTWLRSNVNQKNEDLIRSYLGYRDLEVIEEEMIRLDQTADSSRDQDDLKLLAEYQKATAPQIGQTFDTGNLKQLKDRQSCSKHYGGLRGQGQSPFCTRVPLLAELLSFGDYAATWRRKKVLGDFHAAHSSWSLKLVNFFNRYFGSLEQLQLLTRSREMYLQNGNSEYIETIESQLRKMALNTLGTLNGFHMDQAQQRLAEIEQQVLIYYIDPDPDLPFPVSAEDPELMVYSIIYQITNYKLYLMEQNKQGDLLNGLDLRDDEDPSLLWADLRQKILKFLDGPFVRIQNPKWTIEQLSLNPNLQSRLNQSQTPGMDNLFIQDTDSLKRLLQSDNAEDHAKAFRLWREWAPFMSGGFPRFNSETTPGFNERGLSEEQFTLYQEITSELTQFAPQFPWGPSYLQYFSMIDNDSAVLRANGGRIDHQDQDPIWQETMYGFKTETISDYTLTALMCSEPRDGLAGLRGLFNHLAGDDDGFSLHFEIPRVRSDDICSYLYQPMHENSYDSAPSPKQSVFAGEEQLYFGLHQAYIHAPENHHPLIFDRESELEEWWNKEIVPTSLLSMRNMKAQFQLMVSRKFAPKIRNTEEQGLVPALGKILNFFRSEASKNKPSKLRLVSTGSLESSLQNELFHYIEALKMLISKEDFQELTLPLNNLNQCIGHLLDSVLSKKFNTTNEECNKTKFALKTKLSSRIPKVESFLKNITDEAVVKADDPEVLILAAQKQAIVDRIEGIFEEIGSYNKMINEQFNFDQIK